MVSDLNTFAHKGCKIAAQQKVSFSANFALLAGFFWYWWYYPYRSRDSLSPVCGIFINQLVRGKKDISTKLDTYQEQTQHSSLLTLAYSIKSKKFSASLNIFNKNIFPKRDLFPDCIQFEILIKSETCNPIC